MRFLLVMTLALSFTGVAQARPKAKKLPFGALVMNVAPDWRAVDGGGGCHEDVKPYQQVCDVVYTRAKGDVGEIDVLISAAEVGATPLSLARQMAGENDVIVTFKSNNEASFESHSLTNATIVNVTVVKRIAPKAFATFQAMWPESIDAEARKQLRAMLDSATFQAKTPTKEPS